MKKELKIAIERMFGEGECLEKVFSYCYIVAGYPQGVDEETFCDWVISKNPSIKEIVDYFISEEFNEF